MISCPNKRLKIWKDLVKAVGEPTAYVVWAAKEGVVEDYLKSLSVQPITKKTTVQDVTEKLNKLLWKRVVDSGNITVLIEEGVSRPLTVDDFNKNLQFENEQGDTNQDLILREEFIKITIPNKDGLEHYNLSELVENYFDSRNKDILDSDIKVQIENLNKAFPELKKEIIELTEAKPTIQPTSGVKVNSEKVNELKSKIQELKSQLPTPALIVPEVIDNKILMELNALNSVRASKRPAQEKKLLEKYGKERIERAKFINENFENIVEKIINKKINFFFDPESQEHKRCD